MPSVLSELSASSRGVWSARWEAASLGLFDRPDETAPAKLVHLPQNPLLPLAHVRSWRFHPVPSRIRQHRREDRRFLAVESRCGLAEVMLSCGLDTVNAVAEFRNVQVRFQDSPFVPESFQQ